MNSRFLVLLLILMGGPLGMLLAWPLIADQARLADMTIALRTQPRSEVVVTGYLKNDKAEPFAIESLLIEEPGKEPYRRLVSLDADRKFELALGPPQTGTYRVAAWTRKPKNWLSEGQEGWLRAPELVVETNTPKAQQVGARDCDYQSLVLWGSLVLAVQAACLAVWYGLRPRAGAVARG